MYIQASVDRFERERVQKTEWATRQDMIQSYNARLGVYQQLVSVEQGTSLSRTHPIYIPTLFCLFRCICIR